MVQKKTQGKSGTKKYGRSSGKCQRYKSRGTREKNKKREAEKRAKKFVKREEKRDGKRKTMSGE